MLAALAELKRDPSALAPLEVGAFGLALRLVTHRDIDDAALIERLGAWRAESMANYPTQFPVTAEGTARWLRDHVLGDADRLMFLIVDADDPHGPAYGHMGFDHAHPSEPVMGLSNVLKGDRERLPRGAMEAVEERMIAWAHEGSAWCRLPPRSSRTTARPALCTSASASPRPGAAACAVMSMATASPTGRSPRATTPSPTAGGSA